MDLKRAFSVLTFNFRFMSVHILDNNLINKIAAGEVVERPASVIKELVENSLDAGANYIMVDVGNGGMEFIEITDNGKGMSKEDAKLCVERHATSKINSLEDLHNILSFGFRGEALAAISSVSKFTLQTKEKGAVAGTEVKNNGREAETPLSSDSKKEWAVKDIGCPEGTKIRVEDLFYNVPARKKFLKSVSTEFGHILNGLVSIALVNYKVRFKLTHNGKIILDYSAASQANPTDEQNYAWAARVRTVLGETNFSDMIPFKREMGEMVIQGFISRPTATKINKTQQYLFVNDRPVYNNIVHKAIYEAYRNAIPKDSHPMFVIKLEIEPELVDVNVHPRKMEVRFLSQQEVFKSVSAVIREIVNSPKEGSNGDSSFDAQWKGASFARDETKKENFFQNVPFKSQNALYFKANGKTEFFRNIRKFNDSMFFNIESKKNEEKKNWRLIGQTKNLYLIVEKEEGIIIIDQHAAHERELFDKLILNSNEKSNLQQLLSPLKLELSLKEETMVLENLQLFRGMGFDIESFGKGTIVVNTIPQNIVNNNLTEITKGLISDLMENMKDDLMGDRRLLDEVKNKAFAYLACRGAVKAGDALSFSEQEILVKKIMDGKIKSTCPHGRPLITLFAWGEIGKRFKRT